ncbi:nucleolar MIF4G domain-containing protein 1-like [Liolophura sinensis]|uniref:nucleolar MIF4G domain-containing protein 1-like n=1 Tax=Liolophura sinensis TaxID=3198878 RepID=UPI003158EF8B
MGKRKRGFAYHKDPANLKRFRSVVEKFVEDASPAVDHGDRPLSSSPGRVGGGGGRGVGRVGGRGKEQLQQGRGQNRKRRRREERKLKKVKNLAFAQRKHVPNMAEYQKNKDSTAAEKRAKKREENQKTNEVKKATMKKDIAVKKEDTRKQGLLEANKQDEKILKQLEKQLKMKKKQHLPKSFIDDGLDYILEAMDSDKLYSTYGQYSDEDEDDVPKRADAKVNIADAGDASSNDAAADDEDDMSDEDSDDDMLSGSVIDSNDGSDVEEEAKKITLIQTDSNTSTRKSILKRKGENNPFKEKTPIKQKGLKKSVSFDESVGDSDSDSEIAENDDDIDDDDDDDMTDETNSEREIISEPKVTLREDIYGRLRDEDGNVVPETKLSGAYIPPAKRLEMAESDDSKRRLKLDRLKKQLKGLVNRVSEANIQPISSQIEEIYRTNSRADVSESLCSIITEACVSTVMTPERLTMELTMLIAILHGNVGPEVGACFVQNLAKLLKSLQGEDDNDGKQLDNLISLFAHLYNFKVIHSLLVFDILKTFTESFAEKDIELILLLLKNVGFTLRKDDPSALKEVILQIQAKANTVDTSHFVEKSRVKFMLETILAIRNNNMRKIPNYDPTHLEHLRKLIRNYVRGGKLTDNQLRISLSDLMRAEETGRWWLVGSAWSGGLTDTVFQMTDSLPGSESSSSMAILESARNQRMNTDTRKAIFCTIMASEDFVDAFEKLLKLGLRHKQEREIIYVVVDCCCQEKTFNPFYAYLLQKFCEYDRRFQMTFQFHLWDKFSLLSQLSEQNLNNLAKLLTHLLATKAISLSVLKTVEFGTLEKPMVRFLKTVLLGILLDHPDHVTSDVFSRIAPLSKLHMLQEGLKLFMHHFLLKSKKNKSLDSSNVLAERIKLAEKSLSSGQTDVLL